MVRARKMEHIESIECRDIFGESGLYQIEEDHADYQGFTKTITIPFRWTNGKASFIIPLYKKDNSIILTMLISNIAPPNAPRKNLYIFANNHFLKWLPLNPSTKLSRVRLFIDRSLLTEGGLKLSFISDTWKASDFGFRDGREIGVLIGWESFLIEYLSKESENLYRQDIKNDFETSIKMGERGERQLGYGWYHLENWRKIGYVRWTQKSAYFILYNDGKKSLHINIYSGAQELEEGVNGNLVIEKVLEEGYSFCKSYPFSVPLDTWGILKFDIPEDATGLLRFCINVQRTRNPCKIVKGSGDNRELGVVVKEIEIK